MSRKEEARTAGKAALDGDNEAERDFEKKRDGMGSAAETRRRDAVEAEDENYEMRAKGKIGGKTIVRKTEFLPCKVVA